MKLNDLIYYLKSEKVNYETEHRFHPTRRWKFDVAIPSIKVAFEYEGLVSKKSRHTTIKGYSGDCEKYNEAQKLGWYVMRYTVLNSSNAIKDLDFFLKKVREKSSN